VPVQRVAEEAGPVLENVEEHGEDATGAPEPDVLGSEPAPTTPEGMHEAPQGVL